MRGAPGIVLLLPVTLSQGSLIGQDKAYLPPHINAPALHVNYPLYLMGMLHDVLYDARRQSQFLGVAVRPLNA